MPHRGGYMQRDQEQQYLGQRNVDDARRPEQVTRCRSRQSLREENEIKTHMGCARQTEAPVGFRKRWRRSALDATKGYSCDHEAENKKSRSIMNSMQDVIEPIRCKTVMRGAVRSFYAGAGRVLNEDE